MNRKTPLLLLVIVIVAGALVVDANARQARRRDRQQQQVTELDTSGLSAEAIGKLYLGTWNDQNGRFWFSIDKFDGSQIQAATFRMAHLQTGKIDGSRLTLVSGSCVPAIGCYSYTIRGTLLEGSRMDIRGTDDSGETVHFVLVHKPAALNSPSGSRGAP